MSDFGEDDYFDGKELQALLTLIAAVPIIIKGVNKILECEVIIPNIPCKVFRNAPIWDTLEEKNGWCFQQNEFTRHCRIVDPKNIRRAWGTKMG